MWGQRTFRGLLQAHLLDGLLDEALVNRGLGASLWEEQSFKLGQENELVGWEEACMAKDMCLDAFGTVLPSVFR